MQLLQLLLTLLTFCFGTLSSWGHTDAQDVYALRILYESLKSPRLSGWSSKGGDPCGDLWQGVQCSGRNVVSIRLPGLQLRGSMGFALGKFTSLTILDLSNNHIGEMIPFQLPPRIVQLHLGDNVLIGSIPYSMKRLMSLTNLNLSRNFMSGGLPGIFEDLSNLQTLDISNNNFTGELPQSLAMLSSLSTLHIQQNELNGTLDVLAKLPLKDLNVENNKFGGTLPPALRSVPLFRQTPLVRVSRGDGNHLNPAPGHRPPNGSKLAAIICGAIAACFVFTLVLFMMINRPCDRREKQPKLLTPPGIRNASFDSQPVSPEHRALKPLPMERYKPPYEKENASSPKRTRTMSISAPEYTYVELQAATSNFSKDNLIGEGLLGRVYKGTFASGRVIAVKKLENSAFSIRKEEDILAIISSIARLHHGNIVELIGFCAENGQCLLLYPHFPKGALHNFMHSSHRHLSWNERVKIAVGAARALEYLHEVCTPSTVHRNFKSANILLDEEFNAYVSDSGLAALVPFGTERQISAQMLGAFGYSAPEYALSGIYTTRSDVYSFGVLMLELLTGREPLDSSKPRSREQSLVSWASSQLQDIDSLSKIADPSMESMYPAKSLTLYAEIISKCIQVEPQLRPCMSEVVQSMVRLLQRGKNTTAPTSGELHPEISENKTGSPSSTYEQTFEKQHSAQ